MGVFKLSSCLIYVGVETRGLRSSEGYEADSGVLRAESWGFCCVAAMIDSMRVYCFNYTKIYLNRRQRGVLLWYSKTRVSTCKNRRLNVGGECEKKRGERFGAWGRAGEMTANCPYAYLWLVLVVSHQCPA